MIRSTRWRLPALTALGALTAGTVALTAGSAGATPEFEITRIFGDTRAATAAAIADNSFPAGSDDAILVRENEFADALAGNYLAGLLDAPILLVQTNAIPAATATALQDLGVDKVTLLGGTTAISDGVAAGLTSAGLEVTRVAGTDRFDTAARIALAGSILPDVGTVGTDGNGDRVAIVSSGRNFPDALSAGPLVFSEHFPQLLTEPNALPSQTATALDQLNIDRVYLTGGVNAISAGVEAALTGAGITVTRIAGDTRYNTSLLLAVEAGVNYGYEADHLNLATGTNFPDALAGGPHAGKELAPILLVPNASSGQDFNTVCDALEELEDSVTSAHLFGGTAAVSDAALDAVEACGQGGTSTPPGTGQIVAIDKPGNTYTFVQTSDNAVREISYDDDDDFTVGGAAATIGTFEDNLSLGDTITFTDDAADPDNDVHALTNVDVTSGLVGEVALDDDVFSIINPVTGTALRTFEYDEPADGDTYSTDGAAASLIDFEADLNEGDTVVVTMTGNPASPSAFALTNAATSGLVTFAESDANNALIIVKNVFGDSFETSGFLDGFFIASLANAASEVYTVGGATTNYAGFIAALSVGDTISVSRLDGKETFALTNAAPPTITGQAIAGIDTAANTFDIVTSTGAQFTVPYTGLDLMIGATTATETEFEAAYSAADLIEWQADDAATSTVGHVKLTNNPLQGQIDPDVANQEYDVLALDNNTPLTTIDYVTGTNRYFIGGTEVTLATWEDRLDDLVVSDGEYDDLIQVIDTGIAIEHRLTTNDPDLP